MKAKDYLRQYYWAYRLLKKEEERLALYRCIAQGASANRMYKAPGAVSQGDRLSLFAAKAADLANLVDKHIVKLGGLLAEITAVIDGVEDPRYNRLLKARYIDLLPWAAIAGELGYTREHVWRLHGQALQQISMP